MKSYKNGERVWLNKNLKKNENMEKVADPVDVVALTVQLSADTIYIYVVNVLGRLLKNSDLRNMNRG